MLVLFSMLFSLLTPLTTCSAQEVAAPSITSDKADYAPGELVTLTGAGWQPGESVHINVDDDQTKSWKRDADAAGAIRDSFNLPDWFVATYKVTATGATSGTATAGFTDGNVKVGTNGPSTTLTWSVHSTDNCTGTATTSGSDAITSRDGTISGLGASSGTAKLSVPATVDSRSFEKWTNASTATSREICLALNSGTQTVSRTTRQRPASPRPLSAPSPRAARSTAARRPCPPR